MSNSISPTDVDVNGLSDDSRKLASYYYMNNYDVKMIKKYFDSLSTDKKERHIRYKTLINHLHTKDLPLFKHIFSIYNDGILFWNDFFQTVTFLSFAPNVAIFYFIISTFSNFTGCIKWDDIEHILKLLKKSSQLKEKDMEYFRKLDVRKNGLLNFAQFFKYTTYNYTLWEPLYRFRISLIETIFPNDSLFVILDRKLKISNIKEYQAIHNGKDPPQPCLDSIKNLILRKPNPLHYDYDYTVDYPSLQQITYELIRKYNNNFQKKYEHFSSRNLCNTIEFPILNKIDKYYRHYRASSVNGISHTNLMTPSSSSRALLRTTAARKSSAIHCNTNMQGLSSRAPSGFENTFISAPNSTVNTPTNNNININKMSMHCAITPSNTTANNNNNTNLFDISNPPSPILRHKSTLRSERRMTLDKSQLLGIVKSSASSRAIQTYLNQSHGNRGLSPNSMCRVRPVNYCPTTISPISPLGSDE